MVFGRKTVVKLTFRGKHESYLFHYNAILKDRVFKKTQSSIEIDVMVVKKHDFLSFVEKNVRLKRKKET